MGQTGDETFLAPSGPVPHNSHHSQSPSHNSKEEHLENQNLLKSRTVSFMLQAIISYSRNIEI